MITLSDIEQEAEADADADAINKREAEVMTNPRNFALAFGLRPLRYGDMYHSTYEYGRPGKVRYPR